VLEKCTGPDFMSVTGRYVVITTTKDAKDSGGIAAISTLSVIYGLI